MKTYDTVVEAINGLKSRGFSHDFNIDGNRIICSDNKHCLGSDDFEIVEMYRFEGNTDPGDEDVVYAVESKNGEIKGVLTSAFGPYADSQSDELIKKLHFQHKN